MRPHRRYGEQWSGPGSLRTLWNSSGVSTSETTHTLVWKKNKRILLKLFIFLFLIANMNLYRIDPICYVLYFSIFQIRKLWVIQIKSFSKVTHLVDEAVRIWFYQSKIYFPPVQCSLSDPEDSFWPSIVGNSLSAKPSDRVWSLNHTLQLAPPLSLSKIHEFQGSWWGSTACHPESSGRSLLPPGVWLHEGCLQIFIVYLLYLCIYLPLTVLDHHGCARAFSSCGDQGLLSSRGAWASLWSTGSRVYALQ